MAAWREDAAHGQIFGAKPGVDQRVGIEREADRRFFLFADGNRITADAADRVALSGHEDMKTEPALIGEDVTLGRVERQRAAGAHRRRDRKSDGWGKRGSVRVARGCRREIKNNK